MSRKIHLISQGLVLHCIRCGRVMGCLRHIAIWHIEKNPNIHDLSSHGYYHFGMSRNICLTLRRGQVPLWILVEHLNPLSLWDMYHLLYDFMSWIYLFGMLSRNILIWDKSHLPRRGNVSFRHSSSKYVPSILYTTFGMSMYYSLWNILIDVFLLWYLFGMTRKICLTFRRGLPMK